jgi:formylglycine-generating enzyme required for sulfatase activity
LAAVAAAHDPCDVSWEEAKEYVDWLSRMTGKDYRLSSEAEWEYAARAGTTTAYFWGNDIGTGNANCSNCGSQWDDKKQTAPVGSFLAYSVGCHSCCRVGPVTAVEILVRRS